MAKLNWRSIDRARLIMANKDSADTTELVYRLHTRDDKPLPLPKKKS